MLFDVNTVPADKQCPRIDYDTCINDNACVEACPEKIIVTNDDGQLELESYDKCPPACRECINICPVEALTWPS